MKSVISLLVTFVSVMSNSYRETTIALIVFYTMTSAGTLLALTSVMHMVNISVVQNKGH